MNSVDEKPYNPLDYDNLTMNLVRELMSRGPYALPLPEPFIGPGVYALFYKGDFEHYASLRSTKADQPIYVGKAEPPGGRKGIVENADMARSLHKRIKEHCASISSTKNLRIEDFMCRYLVVVPLWITMAERFLIEHYRPVWNLCLDGFGNHHPGKHRFDGDLSSWDLMHPGRQWAEKLNKDRAVDQVLVSLREFLATAAAKKLK